MIVYAGIIIRKFLIIIICIFQIVKNMKKEVYKMASCTSPHTLDLQFMQDAVLLCNFNAFYKIHPQQLQVH